MKPKTWLEKKMYSVGISQADLCARLGKSSTAVHYALKTGRIAFRDLEKVAAILKEPVEVIAATCGYIPYSLKEWMKEHPYEWYDVLRQMQQMGYLVLKEEDFICPQRRRRKKIKINPAKNVRPTF